jgi:uncharacterized membrane protein
MNKLLRVLKHRWLDASDTRRAITPSVVDALTQRVAASERRHSGEVRIYVEASLPLSYLWRSYNISTTVRERAVTIFGKLGVWDTRHNNGVLIYLLLAEHAIEIVADRGLNDKVSSSEWQAVIARMAGAFKNAHYEDGLTQALEEVSALLVQHYPVSSDEANPNELSNQPVLR